jgi:hypothetical protein
MSAPLFLVVLGLIVLSVFLCWPESRVNCWYHVNLQKKFHEDNFYYVIETYDGVTPRVLLLTREQFLVAENRARSNPEDVAEAQQNLWRYENFS